MGCIPSQISRKPAYKILAEDFRAAEKIAATDHSASINFQNTLPIPLQQVQLIHRFGSGSNEQQTWTSVDMNATTSPNLIANYQTGKKT
jgi:hypothetical protein